MAAARDEVDELLDAWARERDDLDLGPVAVFSRISRLAHRVDRLAGRGLVERHPDPSDRRGVLVRLTPEGKQAVDGAFTALLDAERELLADLSPADQAVLAGLLRRLL